MKLTTRFSCFFLAALAAVLVGFSVTLYFLADGYLYRQMDERLNATLDTLEGSIDVEPGGLEWEPQERRILLGMEDNLESVRWVVLTINGTVIDRSQNRPPEAFANWRPVSWPTVPPDGTALGDISGWRMGGRRLLLEDLLRSGRGHAEDDGPENDIEYPSLIILAGLAPEPVAASLRQLAWSLAGISTGLWVLCSLLGTWLGRWALSPVVKMADTVGEMSAALPRERIPPTGTHDELEQLGEAFNSLLGRLHTAIEHQRRFAGDASHQLRTPLTGLLALVDVLRRKPRSVSEYIDGLDQVHNEADRMRRIVESLLFLARSDADALPLQLENIDLSSWLPLQFENWSTHARANDLRLEIADAPLELKTQPSLLAELFNNLVDNAIKYSEPGDIVTVRVCRNLGQFQLLISDSGSGIDFQDLPHLFEPFYRSRNARLQNRRGVGLGLAIVQRIVQTLGATIVVTSQPGQGTQFVVTFPLESDASSRSATPAGTIPRQADIAAPEQTAPT